MEEYYKIRYNLYKYFFNVDNDNYNTIVSLLIYIILSILMGLSCFLIVAINSVDFYLIAYVIILILYIFSCYYLITILSNFEKDNNLNTYKQYYDVCNTIYRENGIIDKNIVPNIKDIEKIFDPSELNIFINNNINNNDILKYIDLNNFDNTRLYFSQNNIPDLIIDYNFVSFYKNKSYIKLDVLFENNTNDSYKEAQRVVLNYINKKYKKRYTTLYIPKNSHDINKYDKYISKIRQNFYIFILLSIYFLIIFFHGLFIRYSYALIVTYIIALLTLSSLSICYFYIIMYNNK
jgi:hypothetical protein